MNDPYKPSPVGGMRECIICESINYNIDSWNFPGSKDNVVATGYSIMFWDIFSKK